MVRYILKTANGCSPVYCSKKNSEVAWLHHKKCFDNPCAASTDINAEDDDKIEGIEHLKLEHFINNGEIDWHKVIHECDLTDFD